ncbi:hypothetical protein [Streptomyces sp. NPDC005930]|uniref:hypothetical protein n=1 Tax=Streptomyces sp. NPDC005930 TaxID=3364736 RepID=UPI0036A459A5
MTAHTTGQPAGDATAFTRRLGTSSSRFDKQRSRRAQQVRGRVPATVAIDPAEEQRLHQALNPYFDAVVTEQVEYATALRPGWMYWTWLRWRRAGLCVQPCRTSSRLQGVSVPKPRQVPNKV